MSILLAILFAILLFSLIIFVHELGHFAAAKLSGVQVNEFSMFMGPALVKWKRGETQYSIRCIPIGGYCAMEGEDEDTDNPRSFQKAATWKRFMILVAGGFMNFVAALLIMVIVCLPIKEAVVPVIDHFESYATINGENGLQPGDEILKMDGERIWLRADLDMMFMLNPGDTHDLVVRRNGKVVELDDFLMETHPVTLEDGSTVQMYGMVFQMKELDFLDRLDLGWRQFLNSGRQVRLSLQMLLSGKAGVSDLTGPVGIVSMMSETANASENALDAFLQEIFAKSPLPLSVKTRLGLEDPDEFPAILEIFNRYPIKELTIHPRVRKQFYDGGIYEESFDFALENSRNPLCFNGDIATLADISRIQEKYPQVQAVMIGRGLVGNPGMLAGGTKVDVLEKFHNELLDAYTDAFGGGRNAMFRMKENWHFLITHFEDSEKLWKRLRKTTDLNEFRDIAAQIFHTKIWSDAPIIP